MFAKVKYQVFIDTLSIECTGELQAPVRLILKDEEGTVCRTMETSARPFAKLVHMKGLNDLPYGVYTLEMYHGEEEMRTRLVKRV
jgi:hypothetical protein